MFVPPGVGTPAGFGTEKRREECVTWMKTGVLHHKREQIIIPMWEHIR